jgi:serpin B
MPMLKFKEVYLDRPFLYMIIDDATGVPVFMGTVMSLDEPV